MGKKKKSKSKRLKKHSKASSDSDDEEERKTSNRIQLAVAVFSMFITVGVYLFDLGESVGKAQIPMEHYELKQENIKLKTQLQQARDSNRTMYALCKNVNQ